MDEAVANLDNAFDLEWAKANVGRYFAETEGFEAAIVIDRDDQPIYATLAEAMGCWCTASPRSANRDIRALNQSR